MVVAKKEAVVKNIDKTVIDVSSLARAANGTAQDVLRSTPEVSVTADGQISVRGNSPVTVLVAGKPTAKLQLFASPYADQWRSENHSGNAVMQGLSANKQTGDFGYFIGSADGAASCGAAVWVQFVPTRTTHTTPAVSVSLF